MKEIAVLCIKCLTHVHFEQIPFITVFKVFNILFFLIKVFNVANEFAFSKLKVCFGLNIILPSGNNEIVSFFNFSSINGINNNANNSELC